MGTTPISLPYTEVVTALQTNMIDGLLTDMFGAFYFYDLPRYTKYCVKEYLGHPAVVRGCQQPSGGDSLPEQ
jgi:TRAP-type C4-dicarboxylate transport system substrate-binding protein